MKNFTILCLLYFAFACEQNTENPNSIDEYESAETFNNTDFENKVSDLWENTDEDSTTLGFNPFASVARIENGELNALNPYDYQGVFSFVFPIEPEFKELPKEDHTTYSVSVIAGGKIYAIAVDDYTALPDADIDKGFTNFIHNAKIKHMGGSAEQTKVLNSEKGVTALYSCYTHEMNGSIFYNDYVTYGIENYIIHFTITSKLRYEAANKVQQFIDGFELK
jgi:hypothetical protein